MLEITMHEEPGDALRVDAGLDGVFLDVEDISVSDFSGLGVQSHHGILAGSVRLLFSAPIVEDELRSNVKNFGSVCNSGRAK